jgi:predicted metal-dependent enzyme (double-stranded beta helix superfamily)
MSSLEMSSKKGNGSRNGNGNGNGKEAALKPKLINGKVWVPDLLGSFTPLPEDDTSYRDVYLKIDSQRFVTLLDWIYGPGGTGKNKTRKR